MADSERPQPSPQTTPADAAAPAVRPETVAALYARWQRLQAGLTLDGGSDDAGGVRHAQDLAAIERQLVITPALFGYEIKDKLTVLAGYVAQGEDSRPALLLASAISDLERIGRLMDALIL
jgi:hypothetical protein